MRILIVELKPNVHNKDKWYYWESQGNRLSKPFKVAELDFEPIFDNSYRFSDSLFICKDDCTIIEDVTKTMYRPNNNYGEKATIK